MTLRRMDPQPADLPSLDGVCNHDSGMLWCDDVQEWAAKNPPPPDLPRAYPYLLGDEWYWKQDIAFVYQRERELRAQEGQ